MRRFPLVLMFLMVAYTVVLMSAPVTLPYPPSQGGVIRASEQLANYNALVAGINSINNAQIASDAAIHGAKIASSSISIGKLDSSLVASFTALGTAIGAGDAVVAALVIAHDAAAADVHGIGPSSAVVGRTETQTLQYKTLDSTCSVADGAIPNTVSRTSHAHAGVYDPAGTGAAQAAAAVSAHAGLSSSVHGAAGTLVGTSDSQSLTNKALGSGCTYSGGAISDTYLAGISGSKVTGDIAGAAGNITGIAAVGNGGTGASSAATARSNLGANAYDITGFVPGTLPDSAVVFYLKAPRAFTLPQNLTDSQAELLTATTGAKSFDIQKNGSSIGTISFSGGATAGTFTFSSAVSFAAGDKLKIVGPSSADATLAGFSFALKGTY